VIGELARFDNSQNGKMSANQENMRGEYLTSITVFLLTFPSHRQLSK
jgi:hypothetical protein